MSCTCYLADDDNCYCFRGEHLAVRNAEGSFYLCQALQQIYKTSKKIRIQWMGVKSGDNPNKDLFIPEYYDKTGTVLFLSDTNFAQTIQSIVLNKLLLFFLYRI